MKRVTGARTPLHVAVVCHVFPKLSETFVLDHVTGLLDRGHDVTIVAQRNTEEALAHPAVEAYGLLDRLVERPVPPRSRGARGRALARRFTRARPDRLPTMVRAAARGRGRSGPLHALAEVEVLRQTADADVVHAHFGPVGSVVATAMLAARDRRPLVATFHGADVGRARQHSTHHRFAELFRRGDRLLTVSDLWRRELLDFGAPEERVDVLRQGVDTRSLSFAERHATSPIRLLSVGRLVEKKGFDTALRAVAALTADGIEVTHRIVGDGPQRDDLERLAAELELGARVEFLGSLGRERVRDLLYDSDVLVAPSHTTRDGDREGIPVVLMEAMATGLAVVSTRHSGIPELVEHGVTGLLADEGDADGVAGHVRTLVEATPRTTELVRRARAHVECEHDADLQLDRLVDTYRRLLVTERT